MWNGAEELDMQTIDLDRQRKQKADKCSPE
jgi:hypothetical protein